MASKKDFTKATDNVVNKFFSSPDNVKHGNVLDNVDDIKHGNVLDNVDDVKHGNVLDNVDDVKHGNVLDNVDDVKHGNVLDNVDDVKHGNHLHNTYDGKYINIKNKSKHYDKRGKRGERHVLLLDKQLKDDLRLLCNATDGKSVNDLIITLLIDFVETSENQKKLEQYKKILNS